nr:hypothetical protein [Tanacetum cinerariifolium]
MPTQTILNAPLGYIGLYTHCFSLANLRLPLNDLFYEVLQHFKVYISRLNPFDKLSSGIERNLRFQRPAHYAVSAHDFDDPILFLASLQSSWEHGQQRPAIFMGGKGFNIGSPSVSINTKPIRADEEHAVEPMTEPATEAVNEHVGTTADLRGSPKGYTFVIHARSVTAHIKERKCKTRGGPSRPPIKRKLAFGSSTLGTVRTKASAIKDDTLVLSIFDDDEVKRRYRELLEVIEKLRGEANVIRARKLTREGFLDNHLDVDLFDLHDHCYARQAVVDNAVKRRYRELLEDFSLDFNIGSPFVSINTKPIRADEEHVVEPMTEPATEAVNEYVGTTADLGGSPKGYTFVIHARSVTTRIKERKCKTRGGPSRPPIKRKLAFGSSTLGIVRTKASAIKDDTLVLSIFDDDE